MPCALLVAGSRHGGTVLNLSATGLYVATQAAPDLGSAVTLLVTPPDAERAVRALVRVARRENPAARAVGDDTRGVGVDIEEAPENYYGLLAELMRQGSNGRAVSCHDFADPDSAMAPGSPPRFRVRIVCAAQGWQTRTVIMSAASEGEACHAAVGSAGAGWRVDLCERG
jgi:hypothetical protein